MLLHWAFSSYHLILPIHASFPINAFRMSVIDKLEYNPHLLNKQRYRKIDEFLTFLILRFIFLKVKVNSILEFPEFLVELKT